MSFDQIITKPESVTKDEWKNLTCLEVKDIGLEKPQVKEVKMEIR